MATGDDPLADMQNLMGYAGLVGPNPYTPFQSGIPFSGGAGPGVGYLAGWPTNALGQQIQPPAGSGISPPGAAQATPAASAPGTTINSIPTQGTGGGMSPLIAMQQAGATPQQLQGMMSQLSPTIPGTGGQANPNYQSAMMQDQNALAAMQQQTAQPAAQGSNPANAALSRQQYLQLLANPGPLPTYGAAGPQAGQTATGTAPPNVLASFLAANAGKNSSFLNTLRGLQTQPGATS
jgi:hypothetical protein